MIQYTADEGRFGTLRLGLVAPEALLNIWDYYGLPDEYSEYLQPISRESVYDQEQPATTPCDAGESTLMRAAHAVAIFEVVNALRDECSQGAGRSRRDERGRLDIVPRED